MFAARFHAHGGPEVFRYEECPDPVVPEGWALVRVRRGSTQTMRTPFFLASFRYCGVPVPKVPSADSINVNEQGKIVGLF